MSFPDRKILFRLKALCIFIILVVGSIVAQDCVENDLIVTVDNTCLMLQSMSMPGTQYGSNATFRCAALLQQQLSSGLDYCPVEVCSTSGWNNATISCAVNECYEPGLSKNYMGRRTCGYTGRTCQAWIDQTPHQHSYKVGDFPDAAMDSASNYCRDPANTRGQPWCYTTDPAVIWEYCEIPVCADLPVNEGDCADCGPPDMTITVDPVCSEYLTPNLPTSTLYGTTLTFTCTSLLSKVQSTIDYCPVEACTADALWTRGSISCGDNECYEPGFSSWYQGKRTCTVKGTPCIRWDEAASSYPDSSFPEGSKTLAGSYCRDPDETFGQPWCFTSTLNHYGLCGLPSCYDIPIVPCGGAVPEIVGGLNESKTYTKMTLDQPLYSHLFSLLARSNLNCATKCNKGHNCHLYTFDSSLQECKLYQQDQAGTDVVCAGSTTCYKRNI